ncbi:hypothetical protein PFICI_04402 [Pestalotiopsis fici W106-1]|uniref:Uncharacterized protein n=1 Tax=Pestalotiopsis fici (strain W106-1 / CGMCC3.15140) TaxID=1229662 RepID=W3XBF6_PESFW|nr:uncharacterized protein PFICI_04402 [Pestalotiopsis fici W106-1]ETS82526.1 hypothetical protein PFICI_04402 [Pestalotiopsis fici W106-1]
MSYFPTHIHDHKHSSQLVDMHLALDREAAPYLSIASSKTSKSHKQSSSSDASSTYSRSSFLSTRRLLKNASSRWSKKSEKDYS